MTDHNLFETPESSQQGTPQEAKTFITLGWVFAGLSLLFLPILFGPLSILFGHLARQRGALEKGKQVMIAGTVALVIGFALGALVVYLSQR